MTRNTNDLGALTRQFVDAFNRLDLDGVVSFFTDDAVFEDGMGNTFHGRAEIRTAFVTLLSGERGQITFTGEDFFAEAETGKVLTSWTLEMDIEGQRKKLRGLDILIFDGNKIKSKASYCKATTFKLEDA